jgi:drug/metabolite transporter (DMT)-like permease
MTYALKFSQAGEGSIIQMSSVIYSSAAGVLLFGDPIGVKMAVGALLVIASAAYISLTRNGHPVCE